MDRRRFIKVAGKTVAATAFGSAGPSLLSPTSAYSASSRDDHYDFLMARVKFESESRLWCASPGADKNLLRELSSVVRCKVKLPPDCSHYKPMFGKVYQFNGVVDFTDMEELKQFTFLFMTTEGHYSLSTAKKRNMKRYLGLAE